MIWSRALGPASFCGVTIHRPDDALLPSVRSLVDLRRIASSLDGRRAQAELALCLCQQGHFQEGIETFEGSSRHGIFRIPDNPENSLTLRNIGQPPPGGAPLR
jgi:hypothetical protein